MRAGAPSVAAAAGADAVELGSLGYPMQTRKPAVNLPNTMEEIAAMLQHHRALEALARRQDSPQRGVVAENFNAVKTRLSCSGGYCRGLHPADLAFVLGSRCPTKTAS